MDSVAESQSRHSQWAIVGVCAVLIFGAALRLIWPADMEFKADEIYSFERTQFVGVTEAWPWTGMNNSADVPHPGMSVWVFIGLARLFQTHDPVSLNIVCMMLNVFALILFAAFIWNAVPATEREPWWWGLALLCVNPIAILFHRKIWPPSVLPALSVLLIWTWWYRSRCQSAFAFGALAAIATQVHPGAFFFVAGLGLWTLIFDARSWRLRWSALGGVIGSLPALPWLYNLMFVVPHSASEKSHWWRLFELKFWVYWLTEPFGFNLQYSLGEDFATFLRWPEVAGRPTYLVAGLHIVLMIGCCVVLARYIWQVCHGYSLGLTGSSTGLLIGAVGIGYGLVLTVTGLPVYRHYLIVAASIACVAAARAALIGMTPRRGRQVLGGLCMAQAALALAFLTFVHNLDRPIRGDYGAPYRLQFRGLASTPNSVHAAH